MRRQREAVHGAVSKGKAGLNGGPSLRFDERDRSQLAVGSGTTELAIEKSRYDARVMTVANVETPFMSLCYQCEVIEMLNTWVPECSMWAVQKCLRSTKCGLAVFSTQ